MEEHNIGSVLVMDGDRLAGILTDRDFSRKVLLTGQSIQSTLVTDIMAAPVYTIHPDQSCEMAMAMMTDHHIRHLPVVEDGMVVGIISMRDVVEEIIYRQRETIRFWEDLTLER
jgi:CBS domain-containing protein